MMPEINERRIGPKPLNVANIGKELRKSGRQFHDNKYKGHFDNLVDSVQAWFGAIAEDPLNKEYVCLLQFCALELVDADCMRVGSATTLHSSRRTCSSMATAT